jgi:MYXO-CTERM domain-containing protein
MLVDSAGTVAGDPQVLTNIGYDVVPPPAPAKVTASAGETRIFVDWKAPRASDVRSYVFYCDSDTTTIDETRHMTTPGSPRRGTPLRPATSVDAAGGETVPGDASAAAANVAAATDDAGADTKDEKAVDESDDGGTAGACAPWSVLLPGTDPESPRSLARYVCGSAGPDDHSTVIDHLKNDVNYVVAVAAADDTGNVSVLSSQACETPIELTDFFELYRKAGGKAGGGLCSISRPSNAPGDGSHLGAAVFALATAVTRRTSRRRRVLEGQNSMGNHDAACLRNARPIEPRNSGDNTFPTRSAPSQ